MSGPGDWERRALHGWIRRIAAGSSAFSRASSSRHATVNGMLPSIYRSGLSEVWIQVVGHHAARWSLSFLKVGRVSLPSNNLVTLIMLATFADILLHTLTKLISFPTVPNDSHREESVLPGPPSSGRVVDSPLFPPFSCRQGAIFLKQTLNQLGAESSLLSGATGKNPLVLATFKGRETPGKKRKRVLFYGVSVVLVQRSLPTKAC